MSISIERMVLILEGKIQFHNETYYSYDVDAQIAKDVGLDKMLATAITGMKQTKIIIDQLEGMLAKLKGDNA